MKKPVLAILIGIVFILTLGIAAQAQVIDPDLQALLDTLEPEDEVDVLVTLSDQVDLKKVKDKNKDKSKGDLRTALITELKDKKDKTQKAVKDFLKGKATKVTSFWIFNGLAVTAAKAVILELADQAGIASIRLDDILTKADSVSAGEGAPTGAPEWNLNTIRAPELWDLGYTGAGIVVAIMDTGVDADHLDLASRWRGGANSWYDPNGEHPTPYDYSGHGTQVMGLIVGGDATATTIGAAPGAQWIAVKMYNDAGVAEYSDIHLGFQWLLDPDDNSNTNDSADVVNNSWGFRQLVDQCFTEFQPDIQALKAAEIAVVFSAGNEGPYPYTSESPANYPESFAVGAVDDTLTIANFSGRGPRPSECGVAIYPDVAAPGVNIKTCDRTFGVFFDAHTYATGTSIAAPHVSGSMALLMGAFPWAGVSELESALTGTAVDLGTAGPDDDYGNGLIDVVEAHAWLEQNLPQCTDADGDGYYAEAGCSTAQDCNDSDHTIYPGAPEIKHDVIDQDCNGYDLTIDIIKATYETGPDKLSVEATSDMGNDANLDLMDYGPMKWNRKKSKWTISVNGAGGDPGTVTVSGIEGSESAPVDSDTSQPQPGELQFSAATYSVAEDGASIVVTVTRTGGSSGALTVDYATSDGSAIAAQDYLATSGTLSFLDGETSRTFTVTILDDSTYEGDEDLNLMLSNPTGGASLGNPNNAVLTINENDPPPGPEDADGDGHTSDIDCNDNDPTVYPGAPETKLDGIDQDCNGYDLTIEITAATYDAGRDKLSLEATSDLGKNANLTCVGFGPMKWNSKQQKWTLSVRNAGGDPGTVTVSGPEGAETASTTGN